MLVLLDQGGIGQPDNHFAKIDLLQTNLDGQPQVNTGRLPCGIDVRVELRYDVPAHLATRRPVDRLVLWMPLLSMPPGLATLWLESSALGRPPVRRGAARRTG